MRVPSAAAAFLAVGLLAVATPAFAASVTVTNDQPCRIVTHNGDGSNSTTITTGQGGLSGSTTVTPGGGASVSINPGAGGSGVAVGSSASSNGSSAAASSDCVIEQK